MNWVRKYKLPAIEAIQFNKHLYIKLEDLWQALHQTFNSAQNQHINLYLLDKVLLKPVSEWLPFSKAESTDTIKNAVVCPSQNLVIYYKVILRFWWLMINTSLTLSTSLIYVSISDFGLLILRDLCLSLSLNQTNWYMILQRLFVLLSSSTCLENLLRKLLAKDFKSTYI